MSKSKKQRKRKIKIKLIFLLITILISLFGFVFISYVGDLSATITGFSTFSVYPIEEVAEPVTTNGACTVPIEEKAYTIYIVIIALSGSLVIFGALVFYEKRRKILPKEKPKVIKPVIDQNKLLSEFDGLFLQTLSYLDKKEYQSAERSIEKLHRLYDSLMISYSKKVKLGILLNEISKKLKTATVEKELPKVKVEKKPIINRQYKKAHELIKRGEYGKARKLLK